MNRAALRALARREAEALAAELGCEVAAFPAIPGSVEARNPVPGLVSVIGQPEEVRAACLEALGRARAGAA